MHHETPSVAIQEHEATHAEHVSRQEIITALDEAQSIFYKTTADPSFLAACEQRNIDPFDMDQSAYWQAFADFCTTRITALRARGNDSPRLAAFELLATTPDRIFSKLAFETGTLDHRTATDARTRMSLFNDRVRNFAREYPELRASDLEAALMGTAISALEAKDQREYAAQELRNIIKGAQHELAFEQILAATGRHYVAATTKEDLKGIDYRVEGTRVGEYIAIDVKASLAKITELGAPQNSAYYLRGTDSIVIYSLIQDHELRDRFHIPATLAQEKAGPLQHMLDAASRGHYLVA